MPEPVSVFLVHNGTIHMRALRFALEEQSVKLEQLESCLDVRRTLNKLRHSCVIFTDTVLPDGTWEDILAMTAKARFHSSVIVVARQLDTKLYLGCIEKGAFDFVVPPCSDRDLKHIFRCAVDGVVKRARTGLKEA
jgi:DNA-binding NtrC family response regulator